MSTPKTAGADCPKCGAPFTAEYVQISGEARWSCACGTGGPLLGSLSIRSKSAAAPAAPAKQGPTTHRHWSDRAGKRGG